MTDGRDKQLKKHHRLLRVAKRSLSRFAGRLLEVRRVRHISQEQAANELSVSLRTYVRYEQGEREPWGPARPFFEAWITGGSGGSGSSKQKGRKHA